MAASALPNTSPTTLEWVRRTASMSRPDLAERSGVSVATIFGSPLSEQLRRDQNSDLEQRVADLSQRVKTLSEALGAADRPAEPHGF